MNRVVFDRWHQVPSAEVVKQSHFGTTSVGGNVVPQQFNDTDAPQLNTIDPLLEKNFLIQSLNFCVQDQQNQSYS